MSQTPTLLNWVHVRPSSDVPLYQQIANQIRDAIVSGALEPGVTLPSTRMFATDLQVSRITILNAYEQLTNEALLETKAGARTRVALNNGQLDAARRTSTRRFRSELPNQSVKHSQTAIFDASTSLAFRAGIPAFDAFPLALWSRLLARAAARSDPNQLDYSHIGGYLPLRAEIARYLSVSRGIVCKPEQVIVVGSVRAAIAAVCDVLFDPTLPVAVEDPGYRVARNVISRRGCEIAPILVDQDGMNVNLLTSQCARFSGAYLTPAHHWPTGVTLSPKRRMALLDWAAANDAWVIEDDYDSEFRFDSAPLPTLYAQRSERVVYIGTFSKTFAPSVRTAYLVAPMEHIEAFEQWAFFSGAEPSLHVQAALAELVSQGHFVRHIARMRRLYKTRRDKLTASMNHHFGSRLKLKVPQGGLQSIAILPPEVSARDFMTTSKEAGLTTLDISGTLVNAPPLNALHLGFAAIPEDRIDAAVKTLEKATRALFVGS